MRIVKDPLFAVPQEKKIGSTVVLHQDKHIDCGEYFWASYAKKFPAHII